MTGRSPIADCRSPIGGAPPAARGEIVRGDVLDALAALAPASVHCVVTSPPYWLLRRYEGVEPTAWPAVRYRPLPDLPAEVVVPAMSCLYGDEP